MDEEDEDFYELHADREDLLDLSKVELVDLVIDIRKRS